MEFVMEVLLSFSHFCCFLAVVFLFILFFRLLGCLLPYISPSTSTSTSHLFHHPSIPPFAPGFFIRFGSAWFHLASPPFLSHPTQPNPSRPAYSLSLDSLLSAPLYYTV